MTTHTTKTQDGQKISFDHYQNGHEKVVIIAHGFFNSKDALLLKELGHELSNEYDVIIMDFRGHGKSGGLFHWTSKEYLDLEAVLEYAKKSYAKAGVIGFSLGAATSLITASRGDLIASLIAVSAPTEFVKIEYRFWELSFENDIVYSLFSEGKIGKGVRPGPFWQKKHKPLDLVEKIICPVLFIHGEADWLIKPWHSKELYKKAASKKKLALIKNGPHAEYLIRKNKTETVGLIKYWFKETL
ncbi:MAG: alpha/beta fold hydrolase [Candidatus Omnitrophica bacterium]|nr:alpha/beta fold hydrolase [Candidatus Omnitrophota bacterium]